MIKIPYEEIVLKLNEKTNLEVTEIEKKVDEKLKALSGLISKEGAAHIVANELGVKIFEPMSGKLQIKNILAGMRDVEAVARVLNVYELREFSNEKRSGKVSSMFVGDETGKIRITMWGDQAESIKKVEPGNIVKIVGGYVRENQGRIEVHMNDRSQLIVNPEGEKVGEVSGVQQGSRKSIKDLSENDDGVELLGTLVQMFDIRFYETCSKCNRRARPSGNAFVCNDHGEVDPAYAYVLNGIVDDGTETIRCVFFRDQANNLLSLSKDQVLRFKDEPAEFEAVKNNLLGTIVKVTGRTNKNSLFNRLEFVANTVDVNPDPEEELKRLNA